MSHAETQAQMALKNARNSMKRLEAVEALIPQILTAVNNAVQNLERSIASLDETQAALVEMQGRPDVEALVKELRRAKAVARIAKEKRDVLTGLAQGEIINAETVSEKSVVSIQDLSLPDDVNQMQYGFFQLVPAFQQAIKGKKVGDTVEIEAEGGIKRSLKVAGIYDPNPNPPAAKTEPSIDQAVAAAVAESTETAAAEASE